MKEYVKGKYIRTIFSSTNGYVIGLMKVIDTNMEEAKEFLEKVLTFTGYFPELKEEEIYLFYGEMVDHPKYGRQLQVEESEIVLPDTEDGLILFLSSDLFKGIGEKLAKRIVDTLGKNAIDKILKEESVLDLVPKLTEKKKQEIIRTLKEYSSSHQTIVELTNMGFTMRDAMSIYHYYRDFSIEALKKHPYQVIEDVEDITFLKIDRIHTKLEIDPMDKERIKACVIYVMKEMTFLSGDTYLCLEDMQSKVTNYLQAEIDIETFLNYLDELILEDKLIVEADRYYLTELYEAEEYIAQRLYQLSTYPEEKMNHLDSSLEQLEALFHLHYNDKQKQAVKSALTHPVTIITGGPGTGKTTIIKAIVNLYATMYKKTNVALLEDVALLAPTGRASKRMSEATLMPASTIHRFLKWDKESNQFMVNEENPDSSKLIIVDEVSMLDTELMASLLKGLTNHIRLVLVGDYHQLPSVGPGNVLKDLIDSDMMQVVHLDLLYRQSEESYIPVLAEEVKNNELSDPFTEPCDDYVFLPCKREQLVESIKKICMQLKEKGYDEKRCAVLAPMYAGVAGIDHLNQELQAIFNPPSQEKKEIQIGDILYRENDKMLQLVNMPDENVFNGDIGVLEKILVDGKKYEFYVNFDGNLVKYTKKELANLKHGFIISIHKSQGSEFELVLMPISMSYYRMLYRKLLYTGITRAKQKLILVGEKEAFLYAVENQNERSRKTTLKEKIINRYNHR